MFKKLLDWMFTSNEEFRLRAEVVTARGELTKANKDWAELFAALTAEKERSRKAEEERDACIKQLIAERDKAQEQANYAWDELSKAKVKLTKDWEEVFAELRAETEKCAKLEVQKENVWAKLESTEEALEVLNEKMNNAIIEKETAFVAWGHQSEKDRKILDCWRSKVVVLKRKLKKSEALCRKFEDKFNFAVAELNVAKASLSIRQQPSNLEIATLIHKQGTPSHREAVQDTAELRKSDDTFMTNHANPKNL